MLVTTQKMFKQRRFNIKSLKQLASCGSKLQRYHEIINVFHVFNK